MSNCSVLFFEFIRYKMIFGSKEFVLLKLNFLFLLLSFLRVLFVFFNFLCVGC